MIAINFMRLLHGEIIQKQEKVFIRMDCSQRVFRGINLRGIQGVNFIEPRKGIYDRFQEVRTSFAVYANCEIRQIPLCLQLTAFSVYP